MRPGASMFLDTCGDRQLYHAVFVSMHSLMDHLMEVQL